MGAQGQTTIDFGAFPGSNDAVIAVSGQAGILATSLVEAWVYPLFGGTTDHSYAEHYVDPPRVMAGDITAGVGFNIRGFSYNQLPHYGKYIVNWVWN